MREEGPPFVIHAFLAISALMISSQAFAAEGGSSAPAQAVNPGNAAVQSPAHNRNAEQEGLVSIPVGTRLMIRTESALSSASSREGERFTVRLEADLAAEGKIIAPRNTRLYGAIVGAQKGGRMAKKAGLAMELREIMIDGQLYPIQTETYEVKGDRQGTLTKTGAGAVIGGAIDGSEGAKKGAGVGLGASAATKGRQVQIAQGTLLEFALKEEARIPPATVAPPAGGPPSGTTLSPEDVRGGPPRPGPGPKSGPGRRGGPARRRF